MKVCFETFGCRLNRAESLEEEAKYLARGWERTESHADAQLIVVRGCSVTARAQRDCERLIDHIRRKYPLKRVIVTGCLPSADRNYVIRSAPAAIRPSDAGLPPVPTRTARAYLKVQDGCSGRCAFCIVPTFRGKSTSVPFDECLARARQFIAAGYHEIVVTGCNLSLYASDNRRLPELVAALAGLAPVPADAPASRRPLPGCRIRLGSVEPGPVAQALLPVMADHPNVCRYLHLPVQSGSTRVLWSMRRPYQARDVDALVRQARTLLPDVGLGCDLMTGFPDETEADQCATISLLSRAPFTRAHVFPFSERPGTVAATMANAVPKEIRSDRAHEIARLADDIRSRFARGFKGKVVEIVVEDEKEVAGWTSEYLWCGIGEPRAGIRRKDLVRILVREVRGHQLIGDLA